MTESEIRMASLLDIGAMKINAITGSGTRLKDFVDLYSLLEYNSLENILAAYEKKYADVTREIAIKAINYFEDVQEASIKFISRPISREQITERLKRAAIEQKIIFKETERLNEDQKAAKDLIQTQRQKPSFKQKPRI